MTILITGAAGFVGSHLIDFLQSNTGDIIYSSVLNEQEASTVRLEKDKIKIADITNAKQVDALIEEVRPNVVYHLAAQSSVGNSWKIPALTYSINIVGTTNLLESLKKYELQSTKVLLIGSAEQYGSIKPEELPVTEEHALTAANPYSISKVTQEMLAKMYVKSCGMDITMVRAFNHIGPGQNTNFVIPDWCSQIVKIEKGEQEPVLKVGNISVKRDFTDVRDIVRAYYLLSQKGKAGEVYNVGTGKSLSLEDILNVMKELSVHDSISVEIDPDKLRPADIPELIADVSKLKEATGWEPQFHVKDTIGDILNSMR